jgi:hypothetical protein
MKSDEKSKQSIHSKGTRTSKDNKSENDDSSMSSKETVMKQLHVISNMLENERKEREQEKKEQMKEKEENRVLIELLKQFKELILSVTEEDNDEEVSRKVKAIARNVKSNNNNEKEENIEITRRQEVEKEINVINQSGLQSPPLKNSKCDSSKVISHSTVTERR